MSNKKELAIIKIDKILKVEQARITLRRTKYKYINMTIEFLEEYKEEYGNKKTVLLKNIEIAKTNLDYVEKGQIYEINKEKAINDAEFINFAKMYEVKYAPYQKDKFLLKNKEKINVLNHPKNVSLKPKTDDQTFAMQKIIDNEERLFLLNFMRSDDFRHELSTYFNEDELFYNIYDVDGFLSILTNNNDFEFYIDIGDMSKKFVPKSLDVFGILVTHYHNDHYNILLEYDFNAKHYILPYGGAVLYNNKQLYPTDEIRLISKYKDKAHLIVRGAPYVKGQRNTLIPFYLHNLFILYFPLKPSPRNKNLESICVKFNDNNVFYPGDSMFYMYENYINDLDYLAASHHGGFVGAINMDLLQIKNVVINTSTKNYNTAIYKKNLNIYMSNNRNVIQTFKNDGTIGHAIKIT